MSAALELLRESSNWRKICDKIDALPNSKLKGDAFELLVKLYLTIEPKYATKLKSVWLLSEVPTSTRTLLNLPDTDEGIDLVAETKDGQYWAIQAKYRGDQDQSLTRKELATFTDLAFNICRGFDLALVCTTTDRFSRKLKLHADRLTFCAGDVWTDLNPEFFDRLHALLDKKLATPKPYTPFKHQERAIENAKQHYIDNGETRGKMIMPCGTGKSLTAYWIAQELGSKCTLIAVPSLALIKQTLEVWARECLANNIDVHWIAVCSDPSVGDRNNDDPIASTQDLGVDIQTDPTQIAHWLAQDGAQQKIVFTTYQSGPAIAKASRQAGIKFDLAISDEAHRTVGHRSARFSHLLFDKNLEANKRLAMTATERRYSGRSDKIKGMDSVDLYGNTFELLSFNAALEADPPILSDYKIVTIYVTREEINELIEKNLFVTPDRGKWNREIEAQMLSALVALRRAMRDYPISHAVSFHSSIAKASAFAKNQEVFAEAFPEFGDLDCFHVSGRTKTGIRARRMREFEASERALVSNARCLSEGVDVPDIDCVLFADPKRSVVDIVQASGRALRPTEDGSISYIVVPVEIGNLDDEVEVQESVFGSVLTILRALASNDERIIEYFRTVAAGKTWVGGNIPFEIVIPEGTTIDAEAFVEAIQLSCWSKLGKLAWRPFEEAREFARGLGLQTSLEWQIYCSGKLSGFDEKPYDVPSSPSQVYADKGWENYSDWLGTEDNKSEYCSFEEARTYAHSLKLNDRYEWYDYALGRSANHKECPPDIPSSPNYTYRNRGWKNWSDFLGTGFVTRTKTKRPYKKAQEFVWQLGLKNLAEWLEYVAGNRPDLPSRPEDIPTNPHQSYAEEGYTNVGDWLGPSALNYGKKRYLPFHEARDFARNLGLKSAKEWRRYCTGQLPDYDPIPANIPPYPNSTYSGKGWAGIGDWLGYRPPNFGARRAKNWRDFEAARAFARELNLSKRDEWKSFCQGRLPNQIKKPGDIPAYPNKVYGGKGWIDWYDWLGKDRVTWRDFESARTFSRSLGLANVAEWRAYLRGDVEGLEPRPKDIPTDPGRTYKNDGWRGMKDWLGSESRWMPFTEAREFVHTIGLASSTEWIAYRRGLLTHFASCPKNIPTKPARVYEGKGWAGWPDWLGTKKD